jgi:uncharacterized protein (DUF302 family)
MAITQVQVERRSLVSSRPFVQVVAAIEAAVGHPDMHEFWENCNAAQTWRELERVIESVLGPSGFMEFTRFDHGKIVNKASGSSTPRILRVVVGNPLIMKRMVEHVPDAGSYAPVTILIDERDDGVHLSYDLMSSYLKPYGNLAALAVARELDSKVEALLDTAVN